MSMARTILLAVALAALLAGCAAAPGRLLISDGAEALDPAQLEAAAAPLVARGAAVAVFVVPAGDATGADLTRRLDAAGLLAGGEITPAALAIYVSFEPRYSELRAGTRWSRSLPDAALREARSGVLNPALRDGRAGEGVAATLQALEARLASPPLIERLAAAAGAVVVAAFALAALAISPLGAGLGRWWRRSPPGLAARWLGDRTPAGRRRLERIVRTTRLRLDDRVEFARSWCRPLAAAPRSDQAAALLERLKALDAERAALDRGGASGRRLEEAMDRLARAYEALGHEASRLAPARPPAKSRRRQPAPGPALIGEAPASAGGAAAPASDSGASLWDGGGSSSDSGPSSDGGTW